MATSPDDHRTGRRRCKKRVGFDIALRVPKGLSLSNSDPANPKAYHNTADPYTEGELCGQWGGKTAALLGASGDGVRKMMEQIEAEVKTRVRWGGKRRKRVKGNMIWVEFTHRTSPPAARFKPPKTTLWVNGVKITAKLWKRLQAMSEEEYQAFWHEKLKDMRWRA